MAYLTHSESDLNLDTAAPKIVNSEEEKIMEFTAAPKIVNIEEEKIMEFMNDKISKDDGSSELWA